MPQTFANSFVLPYSWAKTALAVWHKYPNPQAEHVVSMDVIDQRFDNESGLLRIERILGIRQGAPKWALKLLGGTDDTYVREVTMVNPSKESFEMTSTNLSLSAYLLVKEYITYQPTTLKPEDQRMFTKFDQKAVIACTGSQGGLLAKAAQKIEEMSYKRFGDNASKGKTGLEHICANLWQKEELN